jgi:flavodoxin I
MFRYDECDTHFLIIYTGNEHALPDDYREIGRRWIACLERSERFGIILVDEPHEHHPDEDEEEHRELEAEINRLINDFRREYRHQTARLNVGYAWVVPPEWMDKYFAAPGAWEQALEQNDRQAQYMWGIPGGGFQDLADAKAWIMAQFNRQPVSPALPITEPKANPRVGLFYGSSTGITEYIAEEIAKVWQATGLEAVNAVNIGVKNDLSLLVAYDCLMLGIPTWNIGQLQDDWEILFPQLDTLDFSGKKVAIFGIGDQYGYPDNFLDAVGFLGAKLRERGVELVGFWFDEHYEFSASKGFVDGKFMGLDIDEDQQAHLTAGRIQQWVAQVIGEFALQPVESA